MGAGNPSAYQVAEAESADGKTKFLFLIYDAADCGTEKCEFFAYASTNGGPYKNALSEHILMPIEGVNFINLPAGPAFYACPGGGHTPILWAFDGQGTFRDTDPASPQQVPACGLTEVHKELHPAPAPAPGR